MALLSIKTERDCKEIFTTPESPEYFMYTDHYIYGKPRRTILRIVTFGTFEIRREGFLGRENSGEGLPCDKSELSDFAYLPVGVFFLSAGCLLSGQLRWKNRQVVGLVERMVRPSFISSGSGEITGRVSFCEYFKG